MKKIPPYLLLALALAGCYQDKGNYEYTLDSMNEIQSVTFSPPLTTAIGGSIIEVQQALDEDSTTRRVEAIVEQTLAKDLADLDFYWYRSYVDLQGKSVRDTVRTKGYLEFDLPANKAMSYNIFLQIYDRSTDLSHYESFRIQTRPVFKNSLFVLHGAEGERKLGNIEVIGKETKIYTDVKKVTKDEHHYENVTGLGYTTYYDTGEKKVFTLYANNGETRGYDPYGMKTKFTADQIFKPEIDNFAYLRTIQTGNPDNPTLYKVVLTETGEVYVGNNVHALYKPGLACEDDPNIAHQTDYKITAATITHNRFLLWDAKNGRFLYSAKEDIDPNNVTGFARDEASSINPSFISTKPLLDAHVKFTGLQPSPAEMSAVMGYIYDRDNDHYDIQNPYFIFRDDATGKYYRYELQVQDIGDGSKAPQRREAESEPLAAYTIQSVKELTGLTPTDPSTITYNSWFTTSTLFFAEGNTVYRYNVSNGDRYPVYEAPEGYEVTKIKFRVEHSSGLCDDLGLHLTIIMHNNTQGHGAIGEIRFTTAADVDTEFEPLFYDQDNEGERWGEIKDVQFVHEYFYKTNEG